MNTVVGPEVDIETGQCLGVYAAVDIRGCLADSEGVDRWRGKIDSWGEWQTIARRKRIRLVGLPATPGFTFSLDWQRRSGWTIVYDKDASEAMKARYVCTAVSMLVIMGWRSRGNPLRSLPDHLQEPTMLYAARCVQADAFGDIITFMRTDLGGLIIPWADAQDSDDDDSNAGVHARAENIEPF